MQRELWGPGNMPPGIRARLLRQTTYMQYGVQKDYQGAKSTVDNGKETIESGGKLYGERCAFCHGKEGLGDGQVPRSLLPSPALLAFMIQRPISVDEYLLWSISEGGKQFDTEMPAFKSALAREDIWRIIAYMRAGFPGASDRPPLPGYLNTAARMPTRRCSGFSSASSESARIASRRSSTCFWTVLSVTNTGLCWRGSTKPSAVMCMMRVTSSSGFLRRYPSRQER
jgi:mono/diheme cytochrome c family protein